MGTKIDTDRTRANMIAAAGELFARHGFHGVTVREICARARASLSALNYHFRDKDGLYRDVLEVAIECETLTAEQLAALESLPPRQALTQLVEQYTATLLAPGGPDWRVKLIEREYLDPSPAFEELLNRKLRPDLQRLRQLVSQAARTPDSDEVLLSTFVMYGIVSSMFAYRRAIEILAPGLEGRCRDSDTFPQLIVDLMLRTARFRGKAKPRKTPARWLRRKAKNA